METDLVQREFGSPLVHSICDIDTVSVESVRAIKQEIGIERHRCASQCVIDRIDHGW